MANRRALLYGGLALFLTLIGMALRHPALLALAIPPLAFWAMGLIGWAGQSSPRVAVRRTLASSRVFDGAVVRVCLEVRVQGAGISELLLCDGVPQGLQVVEGHAQRVLRARPGQQVTLEYAVRAPRGCYRWREVAVRGQAALSAGAFEHSAPCSSTLWSLPHAQPAGALALAPRRTRVYAGVIRSRRGGEGLEFYDTREYAPGDEVRRIHWKATARTGKWVTTQFEQERIADVAVVLDARKNSSVEYEGHSLFEHTVRAAASLALATLTSGNRVGLLSYGRTLDWTLPGHGRRQRERILRALSRVKLGSKIVFEGLEHLPKRLFPTHSQLILISPLREGDVEVASRLQAHGFHLLLVSPNPVCFEAMLSPKGVLAETAIRLAHAERNAQLRALRQARVDVVDWDVRTPLNLALVRSASCRKA